MFSLFTSKKKKKFSYGTWQGEEIRDDDEGRRALIELLLNSTAELYHGVDEHSTRHAFTACISALVFILRNARFGG